jgi:hypothetical protein
MRFKREAVKNNAFFPVHDSLQRAAELPPPNVRESTPPMAAANKSRRFM